MNPVGLASQTLCIPVLKATIALLDSEPDSGFDFAVFTLFLLCVIEAIASLSSFAVKIGMEQR